MSENVTPFPGRPIGSKPLVAKSYEDALDHAIEDFLAHGVDGSMRETLVISLAMKLAMLMSREIGSPEARRILTDLGKQA